MKKRNSNKWIVILLIIMFITTAAPVSPVQAASATVTVSSTNTEIHVGDTVEVILTIKADTPIGDFECYLNYDDSVFEFQKSDVASCITGGGGSLRISDIGASRSEQERSYKIIFNAIDKGECRVEIYGRPMVYGYADGTEMSVTAFSKTFLVYPSYLASADSSLATLHLVDSRIKTVALTPVFSPEMTTYYASVPYDASSVIVSAIAGDAEHATVKVFGDGDLSYGTNEVRIAVTAEDGSSTEYLVYLYRAEKPEPTKAPENPGEEDGQNPPEHDGENAEKLPAMVHGVVLEETETDILITEYHTYRVCEKPSAFLVPDGYAETVVAIDEVYVTAYAKQGETEEFLLMVLANERGQVRWYRYDRVEQTLQRVSDEEFVITQNVISNEEAWQEAVRQYEVRQKGLMVAVALLTGIVLFLAVLMTWMIMRNRRQKNEG